MVALVSGQGSNPCEDERYLRIKNKTLDEMSDREYEYFIRMDKECKQYKSKGIKSKQNNKGFKEENKSPFIKNKKEIEDYTIYLKNLGCKLGQAIGGEIDQYYYRDKAGTWVKIEDHWSYLKSIGIKKGENINRDKGSLYIYKGSNWQKLIPQNQSISKNIQNNSRINQNYADLHIYGGYDVNGTYISRLNIIDGEETEEIKEQPSFGAFIQFGNSKSFTIIAGESGASIALRHNFLK